MVVALLVILFGVLVRYSGEWGLDGVISEAADIPTVDPGSPCGSHLSLIHIYMGI